MLTIYNKHRYPELFADLKGHFELAAHKAAKTSKTAFFLSAHHTRPVSYTHLDVYKRQKGYLDYVITTNLNYRPANLFERPWYLEADMSKYLAAIINSFNHDASINQALSLIHI